MTFGEHLRELRKQAGISQRELAESVKIDFTYLSKIENNRVEPPREVVIRKISHELSSKLNKDETKLADELTTLAGKVPFDVAEILSKNPLALAHLRSLSGDVQKASDWSKVIKPAKDNSKK